MRRLALFVYLDHPAKDNVTFGSKANKTKFKYGIVVLSVSKMLICRNRSDIFNVLFDYDKQINFVFRSLA